MAKLKVKLALFNLLSKMVFSLLFLILMPLIANRINLIQVDNNLIEKREKVISLISDIGIEPFITSDTGNVFGNYNIFKEEFISLEKINTGEDENFIEISSRMIEDESIVYRVLNYSFKIDGNKYLLEVGKSLSSIHETEQNIKKVIWLFLISIIIITFLTDLYYTGRLLKPLDKITKKLRGISEPSIFDKKPVDTSTIDFIQLDNTLIELMEHIDNLFKKEKEITVNISHELLTPVSVLRSKLENLLMKENSDPEISEKIEESLKMLFRLQSLINSLLLIARIESQQCLREDTFSINEVMSEIVNEINPIAEDKAVSLIQDYKQDFTITHANRPLIFSMFYNIVNNAVKNTETGTVSLKSFTENNKFIVTVTDTGKGMTTEQIATLFSRFKTRIVNEPDGTGIGLAIAKTIAEFHQIEITVKSVISEGSCFSFIFPENS